jgi:hypothetical protein
VRKNKLPPEPTNYARGWDHGYEAGYAAKHKLVSTRLITRRERDAILSALRYWQGRSTTCKLTGKEIALLCEAIDSDEGTEMLRASLIDGVRPK